jgi:hypothetical protein
MSSVAPLLQPTRPQLQQVAAVGSRAFMQRWAFALIVGFYILVAIVGFTPRSVAILSGERANPALVIHVHAAFMVVWLFTLLLQASLVAMGKRHWHKTVGIAAFALGPLLLLTMLAAAWHTFHTNVESGQLATAAHALLRQGRAVVYFVLFFTWAMWVRKQDAETHKRLLLLATASLLPAAVSRMTWLPASLLPTGIDGLNVYMLLLLLPALLYDLWSRGRVHVTYLKGLLCLLPWFVAAHYLWNSAWWESVMPTLLQYFTSSP